MSATKADVITSAPSVWGAANATSASRVFPTGAPVALALGTLISDPAQIWHAGDRFGHVAELVRTAKTQMAEAVERHASADQWSEQGRDAFVAGRVRPYQNSLDQAASMFDDMDDALRGCAVAYTAVGLTSAIIGSALLSYVAPLLAAAVPGANITAGLMGNAAMVHATLRVRKLIAGLAQVNGVTAALFAKAGSQLARRIAVGGMAVMGGRYVVGGAGDSMMGSVRAVPWPTEVRGDAQVPAGYRVPAADQADALKLIHPESVSALGKALDEGVGRTLTEAHNVASGNDVGVPGFGVVGTPVAHAYSSMRSDATDHLAAGRDEVGNWLPGLRTAMGNWAVAEDATLEALNKAHAG